MKFGLGFSLPHCRTRNTSAGQPALVFSVSFNSQYIPLLF